MSIRYLADEADTAGGNHLANLTAKSFEILEILRREMADQEQMSLEFTDGKEKHIQVFFKLYNYAQNKQVVSFNYKPIDGEKKKVTILPRIVAERDRRMYCIGFRLDKQRHQVYAIDRIYGSILEETWFQNLNEQEIYVPLFSKKSWFSHIIGISNEDAEILDMELLYTPKQALYMREYPIHTSEKAIYDDERGRCTQVQLKNTYELRAKILELGSGVEVLKPEKLRNEIKGMLQQILKTYEK